MSRKIIREDANVVLADARFRAWLARETASVQRPAAIPVAAWGAIQGGHLSRFPFLWLHEIEQQRALGDHGGTGTPHAEN